MPFFDALVHLKKNTTAAAIDISPEPEDGEDEPYLPCREERTLRAQPAGGSGDRMLVTESDIELTDTSEPTLMKSGKGLKRTYAMADIMPKKRARDVDLDVSDYEPLMDLEQGSETDDIAYEIELVSTDDEETPENRIIATEPAAKKANRGEPASNKVLGNDDYETSKKKATKLAVREAVHANRGEPASKKKEEVSNEVNLWNLRALTTWERSHRHHKFLTGTCVCPLCPSLFFCLTKTPSSITLSGLVTIRYPVSSSPGLPMFLRLLLRTCLPKAQIPFAPPHHPLSIQRLVQLHPLKPWSSLVR